MITNKLLLTLFITLIAGITNAQEAFNFSKNQIKVWELAKQRTIEVAKSMPEAYYNYSPTEGIMSFGQQMTHISNSMLSMQARFILDQPYLGSEKDASKMSKNEIIAELENAFNSVITGFSSLNDEVLQAPGKKHGAFPLTKWQSLLFMRDHITNHRAKAVLYLRLKNITPPSYGFN